MDAPAHFWMMHMFFPTAEATAWLRSLKSSQGYLQRIALIFALTDNHVLDLSVLTEACLI